MSTQSNFFSAISKIATPYVKTVSKADPLTVAKTKFDVVALEQIKLLKEGAKKGYWFKQLESGAYVCTLKNGPSQLLPTAPAFQLKDSAAAVQFIEAAREAAKKGEFDESFTATSRAAKQAAKAAQKDEEPGAKATKTAQKKR